MTDEWWLEPDDEDAADDLTDDQAVELHGDLQVLEVELTKELEASSDRTETVDLDQPIGRISRVDALQQQKMAQAQRQRLRARLSLVKVMLKVADAGDYGECRRCGEAIGYDRLKAQPEAPVCVACAKSAEKKR
jgi:DnaK suppressor protein